MISSKPPNILFPNLVLWCIIMSQSVMQKDWFAIFKVKFTARALMIKIWQFLWYLLNCWSFSTKLGLLVYLLVSQSVLWKNWIVVVKVTAKFQNVNECLSRYFLNRWTFYYQTWYANASLWAILSRSRSQQHFTMSMNDCPDDLFWIAELFCVTKLGMVMHHYEPDCLSKRLVFCLQDQGHR